MRVVLGPKDLGEAWQQQYERLAEKMASLLLAKRGILVEIGCGKGQLTIPLAQRVSHYRTVAIDNFKGPYSADRLELSNAIARNKMRTRINPVVGDYLAWLTNQPPSRYDATISSEFLPEIDTGGTHRFFAECHRVLRNSGVTIHSFLSPVARNHRQKRLIEADSNPKWTETPPVEWFSPPLNLVVNLLKWVGFRRLRQFRFASGLIFRSDAAREVLRRWDVRGSYWKTHRRVLEREGLEIPDWIVVSGFKQS